LLLFRIRDGRLEILLAHPGGPIWASRDDGAWSVPKGEIEPGEDPLSVARREFQEETGSPAPADLARYRALGEVRQKSGKVVAAWAVEGDLDPASAVSNTFEMEWPPRSGRRQAFPEVDRVEWFDVAEARRRINPAQARFLDLLEEA
jgi:predicted NUDIX family NTP pyrophosphohydrolase